jgi:hypothetical protein
VLEQGKGPFQEIGGVADFIEIVAGKGEGGGGHLAEAAIEDHGGRDGKQFHTGAVGGLCLLQRFDAQHGELMRAACIQQIADGGGAGHFRVPR